MSPTPADRRRAERQVRDQQSRRVTRLVVIAVAIVAVVWVGGSIVSHHARDARLHPSPTETRAGVPCDPNYSGCVPVSSNVDCQYGGGPGPDYLTHPERVVGSDVYDLDADGDGIACN